MHSPVNSEGKPVTFPAFQSIICSFLFVLTGSGGIFACQVLAQLKYEKQTQGLSTQRLSSGKHGEGEGE